MKSETVRALGPEQLRQNIHIYLIHGMYVVITGEQVSAVLTITLRSNVGRCLVVALKKSRDGMNNDQDCRLPFHIRKSVVQPLPIKFYSKQKPGIQKYST